MNKLFVFFVAMAGVFCASAVMAEQKKETIIWAVGHNPPRVEFDDGVLGGHGGMQQRILDTHLSQFYKPKHVSMTWARIADEIKNSQNVCASFLMKNPQREAYMTFSIPWHIDLPHRVIMRTLTWEFEGRPDSISLAELSQNVNLRGLIGKGRSYGNLDPAMQKIKDGSNILTISTGPVRGLNMLARGRIDYIIEFPYYLEHFIEQNQLSADGFKTLPIEEAGDYNFVYVGCPKNPWGEQVIERVNEVVKQVRSGDDYLTLLKSLYRKKEDQQKVESIYHDAFLSAQ